MVAKAAGGVRGLLAAQAGEVWVTAGGLEWGAVTEGAVGVGVEREGAAVVPWMARLAASNTSKGERTGALVSVGWVRGKSASSVKRGDCSSMPAELDARAAKESLSGF